MVLYGNKIWITPNNKNSNICQGHITEKIRIKSIESQRDNNLWKCISHFAIDYAGNFWSLDSNTDIYSNRFSCDQSGYFREINYTASTISNRQLLMRRFMSTDTKEKKLWWFGNDATIEPFLNWCWKAPGNDNKYKQLLLLHYYWTLLRKLNAKYLTFSLLYFSFFTIYLIVKQILFVLFWYKCSVITVRSTWLSTTHINAMQCNWTSKYMYNLQMLRKSKKCCSQMIRWANLFPGMCTLRAKHVYPVPYSLFTRLA